MKMVKVVDKSLEEIKEEDRKKILEQIAENVLGKDFSFKILGRSIFGDFKKGNQYLHIDPSRRIIYVQNEELLGAALRLAETYESRGEPEFTVKKEYVD